MNQYLKKSIHKALIASLCTVAAAPLAWGAPASNVDIGTVHATTTGNGKKKIHSAAYQAPSTTPLKVSQPTSVVTKHYIKHNVAPTANFDTMIKHTPSVMGIAPNGPGMTEDPNLEMRGFQDGEYNVTFDSMPWGDSNDFTHHSTTYFMSHDISQVDINRGPGTAANVGQVTYGGTIALHSKMPSTVASFNPYLTVGSWNTQLYGLEFDTGLMPNYNNSSALLDFERSSTDGYLTNAKQKRQNAFFKFVNPISDNTTLTVSAMYNHLIENIPAGHSKAQMATLGNNWGLSLDPTQENYAGYNYDNISSDFEYIRLQSYLGDNWSLDNKLYTYAYYHHGYNGNDASGLSKNGADIGATTGQIYGGALANDAIGQKMEMNYRSVGDFFRVAKDISIGTINLGIWYDHQYNDRFQYDVDWSKGGVNVAYLGVGQSGYNTKGAGNPYAYYYQRLMHDTLDTMQPYAELAWKPTSSLTITPGVKYAYFHRNIDALVNDHTMQPLNYSKSWSKALPALDIHYKIQPGWVAYAQAAEGYQAPKLQLWRATQADISQNTFKPSTTWNYQVGTTFKNDRLDLSADAYYITVTNLISSFSATGGSTVYKNQGKATYKGVEAAGTVYVGDGFSLYGYGSINSAKDQNHMWIIAAPESTAGGGIIYNQDGWYASLLDNYIGKQFGDVNSTDTANLIPIAAYSQADAAVSYTLKGDLAPSWLQSARVNLQVHNLFDKHSITALFGYAGNSAGTPLYWSMPGRSYFLTVSAHI